MKILEIRNLTKKENYLHYRNEYSGSLVYSFSGGEEETDLVFCMERTATGQKHISINFPQSIHYPLVPAIRKVKDFITDLENRGALV